MAANLTQLAAEELAIEYRIDLVNALWETLNDPSPELVIDIPAAGASFKIGHLSVDERIQLAQDIWDTVPEDYVFPLSDAMKAELDRRIDEYERNPESGIPWEEVKASLMEKYSSKSRDGVD